MKTDWMSDARLIPDETMSYLRKIAVRAVREFAQYSTKASQILLRQDQVHLTWDRFVQI